MAFSLFPQLNSPTPRLIAWRIGLRNIFPDIIFGSEATGRETELAPPPPIFLRAPRTGVPEGLEGGKLLDYNYFVFRLVLRGVLLYNFFFRAGEGTFSTPLLPDRGRMEYTGRLAAFLDREAVGRPFSRRVQ
jgi:hypothetical protein